MYALNRLASIVFLSCCVIIFSCTLIIYLSQLKTSPAKLLKSGYTYSFHDYTVSLKTNNGLFEMYKDARILKSDEKPADSVNGANIIVNSPYSLFFKKNYKVIYRFDKTTHQVSKLDLPENAEITSLNDSISIVGTPFEDNIYKYTLKQIDNRSDEISPLPSFRQFCSNLYCGLPRGIGMVGDEILIAEGYGDSCGGFLILSRYNPKTFTHIKINETEFICGEGDNYLGTDGEKLYFEILKYTSPEDYENEIPAKSMGYWSLDPYTLQRGVVKILPANIHKLEYMPDISDAKEFLDIKSTDTPITSLKSVSITTDADLTGADQAGHEKILLNLGWLLDTIDPKLHASSERFMLEYNLRMQNSHTIRFITKIQPTFEKDAPVLAFRVMQLDIQSGNLYELIQTPNLNLAVKVLKGS